MGLPLTTAASTPPARHTSARHTPVAPHTRCASPWCVRRAVPPSRRATMRSSRPYTRSGAALELAPAPPPSWPPSWPPLLTCSAACSAARDAGCVPYSRSTPSSEAWPPCRMAGQACVEVSRQPRDAPCATSAAANPPLRLLCPDQAHRRQRQHRLGELWRRCRGGRHLRPPDATRRPLGRAGGTQGGQREVHNLDLALWGATLQPHLDRPARLRGEAGGGPGDPARHTQPWPNASASAQPLLLGAPACGVPHPAAPPSQPGHCPPLCPTCRALRAA